TALAVDPANLVSGTHTLTAGLRTLTITDGIRLVAQAGTDDFIDLKGRLRDPAAKLGDPGATPPVVNPHVFNIDLIQAGMTGSGTADVILQAAVKETGTGNAGLVRVTTPLDPANSNDSSNDLYANQFRPDDPRNATAGASQDVAFYGNNGSEIKATYNFVLAGNTAGLIAAGPRNI